MFYCVLFIVCLYVCVCESLLKNNNHKTQHKKLLIARVPSSQALPGFPVTAPPSMCVPDVIGALVCGFQTKKKNGIGTFLSYQSVLVPHSLLHTDSRRIPAPWSVGSVSAVLSVSILDPQTNHMDRTLVCFFLVWNPHS